MLVTANLPTFAWLGRVFSDSQRRCRVLAAWLAAFTVLGALSQHPHYLGYFDPLFGGPRECWRVFADGEIDWGQDLPALARWQHDHPEARPMRLALFTPYAPPYHGLLDDNEPPQLFEGAFDSAWQIPRDPFVGWLAIGVTLVNRGTTEGGPELARFAASRPFLRWLVRRPPTALVGTSILIYRMDENDVLDWNHSATSPSQESTSLPEQ